MSQIISELYNSLVNTIIIIIKENNLERKLKPLNLDEDSLFLFNLFTNSFSSIQKSFCHWGDNEWIKSMSHVPLGILSFLYKQKITMEAVYNMAGIHQTKLLNEYKKLVANLRIRDLMTKGENCLIEELSCENDFENKTKDLIWGINKNFKDPKNVSLLIDLLGNDYYRTKIVNSIANGMSAINMDDDVENNKALDVFAVFCKDLTLKKTLDSIMKINLKGDILVIQENEHIWRSYFREILNNSLFLQNLKKEIDNEYTTNQTTGIVFKNKINLKICKNDFLAEYSKYDHIKTENIDIDSIIMNDTNISYNFYQLHQRVLYIILFVIENIGYYTLKPKNSFITEIVIPNIQKIINNNMATPSDNYVSEYFSKIEKLDKDAVYHFCNTFEIPITDELTNLIESKNLCSLSSIIEDFLGSSIPIQLIEEFKIDIERTKKDIIDFQEKRIKEFNSFTILGTKLPKYYSLINTFLLEFLFSEKINKALESLPLYCRNPILGDFLTSSLRDLYPKLVDNDDKKNTTLRMAQFLCGFIDKSIPYLIKSSLKKTKKKIVKIYN